jgi:hypothetical protein
MPEEVCKLVRDQDHNGEFFDSIENDENLLEGQICEESHQEDPMKIQTRHLMKMKCSYLPFHLMKTSRPLFLLHIKKRTW